MQRLFEKMKHNSDTLLEKARHIEDNITKCMRKNEEQNKEEN